MDPGFQDGDLMVGKYYVRRTALYTLTRTEKALCGRWFKAFFGVPWAWNPADRETPNGTLKLSGVVNLDSLAGEKQ